MATLGALCLFVAVTSGLAVATGYDETRLILAGPRRDVTASELPVSARGWYSVFGCVRHDLAAQVTQAQAVYRLGTHSSAPDAGDRIFTPVSAYDDCDAAIPPRRIYALVEDDDALGNTLGQALPVAPPPVPAMVDGVIGYGAGHPRLAVHARAFLGGLESTTKTSGGFAPLDVIHVPLLMKGKRPGVLWVAATTLAAGAHGFLLLALMIVWVRRRVLGARRLAAAASDDPERQFFAGQPLKGAED